jgi:pimeloyl-ACP methyl ester carboxylesterase
MQENTYINRGTGKDTLVFLHYFGGEAVSWQWIISELETDYRCIALNLPGFGGTQPLDRPTITGMAQWVLRQLALLDVFDFTLIGHSMGGKIALQLAALPSEMEIHQVILMAPSPPTQEPMPEAEKQRMLRHPDKGEAMTTVSKATVAQLEEQRADFAVQSQLKIDQATWHWWLKEGMNHSIAESMQDLGIPVTVIASEDDPVITMDVVRQEVIPVLPSARLVTTRAQGHLMPLEAPRWLADQIRQISKPTYRKATP